MLFNLHSAMPSMVGALVSFVSCLLLVLTQRWHGRMTYDTMVGVQKFHVAPTPRVAGISIYLGLLAAWGVSGSLSGDLMGALLVAGLPAFLSGLAEDLTKRVSVRNRLLATMASGVLAWYLTGYYIAETEVWGLDSLLVSVPLAVSFTAFAVGGMANSINIIDGFNGLAGGSVLVSAGALALIASSYGDVQIAMLSLQMCAVTVGFMCWNFPFGKIFLGDGGAYLLGFMLAWIAVMLPMRNPEISVWCPLLACGYPIIETLFSMGRRVWTKAAPGQPDREHLHNLIKLGVARRFFAHLGPLGRNAVVSPFAWSYAIVPPIFAVAFSDNTSALVFSLTLCFALYALCYWKLAQLMRDQAERQAKLEAEILIASVKPMRAHAIRVAQDVAEIE
jgi:UDP-N-acetylmuramyl pentapeptide phosphotransferase/UDP-N-acetylglucosamine-1-phosphate transferase